MATGWNRLATPCYLLPLLLLVLMISSPPVIHAADSLALGEHMSRNQTLVSKQGLFELGFFSPGRSTKLYLGVWYKNIGQRTYVWVANRDKPISESDTATAILKVSVGDGGSTFALFANTTSKTPIWSAPSSTATGNNPSGSRSGNSTRLMLLDTGNLVLIDGNSTDPSAFLWESFDHPTDTVVQGGRIGYNRTSGRSWVLTSWKSSDDPAPGSYSFQIDSTGATQFFLVWGATRQPYWATGLYDGRIFANLPEMTGMQEFGFNHSDPSDTDAKYFSYFDRLNGVSGLFVDTSGILKWQLWVFDTAQWQVFTRIPKDPCLVPSHCGAFGLCNTSAFPSCQCLPGFDRRSKEGWAAEDYTAGCVRKAPLACGGDSAGGAATDGFLPVDAVLSLPEETNPNGKTLLSNVGSRDECQAACLKNCSCTAYSYDGSSGCQVWIGDLMNLKQVQQGSGAAAGSFPLHLRVASAEVTSAAAGTSSSNKKKHSSLAIGLLSGVLALLLLSVLLAWWCTRTRNRGFGKSSPATQGFMPYRYKDIQKATRNFSEVLGRGGFGAVYRGTLPDDNNTPIAVKKLEPGLGVVHGDKQFRSEVSTMASIQHINILQLRGVCCQGPHRILVYDFMPNGSLDSHLFPIAAAPMPWAQRHAVAVGVARGLAYLHDKCRDRIVHCDVKPENILLDANMCPKVADFGMAKLIGRDFSRALTTMRGTVGYLAPEWISGAPITPKADVYSFGMMLFEIVSGRRNGQLPLQPEQSNGDVPHGSQSGAEGSGMSFFPMWAATNVAEGRRTDLEDHDPLQEYEWSKADGGHGVVEFRRACRAACWCVQDMEEHRPTMAQVVQMLEGVLDLGVPPIPRHLRNHVDNEDAVVRKLSLYSLVVDS